MRNKKKVIFMLINMNIGGTEKAFLNMVSRMPEEHYDITLLLLERNGGFLKSVPRHVRINVLNEYSLFKRFIEKPLHSIVLKYFKKGKIVKGIIFLYFYLTSKINKEYSNLYKYLLKEVKFNEDEYDIAIAYAGPMDFISYFVLNYTNAKKKIQWIHFDITKIGFNKYFASKYYKDFDRIFVVSKEGKEKIVKILPELEYKTGVVRNKISKEIVQNLAYSEEGFKDNFTGLRVLTVGRLSFEKGQDLAIKVMAKLKKDGLNVKWYCIGEGSARKSLEDLIRDLNLENDFVLLGAKENPYPYMNECDVYVQPSRHEGFCITLAEAKCFNNPIIATNFTGAKEQIFNHNLGLIVEFSEQQLYESIKQLIII
jgi:glycosyltransferase involved in cell wall biosynthesis